MISFLFLSTAVVTSCHGWPYDATDHIPLQVQALEVVWNQNPQVSFILQLLHIQLSKPTRCTYTRTHVSYIHFWYFAPIPMFRKRGFLHSLCHCWTYQKSWKKEKSNPIYNNLNIIYTKLPEYNIKYNNMLVFMFSYFFRHSTVCSLFIFLCICMRVCVQYCLSKVVM